MDENKGDSDSIQVDENTPDLSINSGNSKDDESDPQETEELMAKGSISKAIYWKYFRAGGSILMILSFMCTLILGQLGSSGSDYWVAYWLAFICINVYITYLLQKLFYILQSYLLFFLRTRQEEIHIKTSNNHTLQAFEQNFTIPLALTEDTNGLINETLTSSIDNFNKTIPEFLTTFENKSLDNIVGNIISPFLSSKNSNYFYSLSYIDVEQ